MDEAGWNWAGTYDLRQSGGNIRTHRQHDDYNEMKSDFQKKLIDLYQHHLTKVPAHPILPERNQIDISDVYITPWMTVDKRGGYSYRTSDAELSMEVSLNEIFKKRMQSIYILGEVGSGKTALCKYLTSRWCKAHSKHGCNTTESDSELEKQLMDFDFLFYIPLRHHNDCSTIKKMLNKMYPDPVLEQVLQNKSSNCVILLDGLDEYKPEKQEPTLFQTRGLPTRDIMKDYTVITTSRKWKFVSLRIKDSEINQTLRLRGLDRTSVRYMTEKMVNLLNNVLRKNRSAEMFLSDLQNSSTSSDIATVPMILQQLLCLWFDDRFQGQSKCAVYSRILDRLFKWEASRTSGVPNRSADDTADLSLPEYLCQFEACYGNTRVIRYLSHLAFETLYGNSKENGHAFKSSKFQQVKMTDDAKRRCFEVGIVSEDQDEILFASQRATTSFSFVHKSIQEYLAAVYIAAQFRRTTQSPGIKTTVKEVEDISKRFVQEYFGCHTTLNDILDQSNVIVVLSGLEPGFATYISEYIYNIAKSELNVVQERSSGSLRERSDLNQIYNIQQCIFGCMEGVLSSGSQFQGCIYIRDIIVRPPFTDNSFRPVVPILPSVHLLESLEINELKLSHDDCKSLCTLLTQSTHLKYIRNIEVLCDQEDEHLVDLTNSEELVHVVVMYGSFSVTNISSTSLEICKLKSEASDTLEHVCSALSRAQKLTVLELTLCTSGNNSYADAVVTKSLIKLLQSLVNLTSFRLEGFNLLDNIITSPYDMKHLKEIQLAFVTMAEAARCSFIDCLYRLPHTVEVTTYGAHIGKDIVKRKPGDFAVTYEAFSVFNFKTRK